MLFLRRAAGASFVRGGVKGLGFRVILVSGVLYWG